jgi:DNA/RNA endonuclease YhcR with UshA esterase domain
MLKAWILLLTLTISIVCAFAQDVSIYDIQYTTNPSGTSPDSGLTVTTGGIVTGVYYSGGTLFYFLSDRSGGLWHGILVRESQDRHLSIGDSVHITAQVLEPSGQTRLQNSTAWDSVHAGVTVPPAVITCADLNNPATQEATEDVLVEVQNVVVAAITGNGTDFTIYDPANPSVTATVTSYGWSHAMPVVGDSILYVRGLVTSTPGGFRINPRNNADIVFTSNRAPIISNVSNSPQVPSSLESDTITAHITDETVVADARVYYRFGSTGDYTPLTMFDDGTNGDRVAGDDNWTALIPPGPPQTLCQYYIWATDDSGRFDTSPPDAPAHTNSYMVSPTMADVYAHLADYEQPNVAVTLVGVVNFVEIYTTSGGSNRITAYFQDNSGRGFYISVGGTAADFPAIVRGNRISVQGPITTYSGQVQIGPSATGVTLLASNQPNPPPIEVKSGDRRLQHQILQTPDPAAYATGTWCKMTGTVYRVDENVGGGTNIAFDDGTGSTTIRWWDSMHIDSVQLGDQWYHKKDLRGKFISIYGPASVYNGDFQMLAAGDVSDFESPPTPPLPSDFTLVVPNRPFAPDLGQHLKIMYNAPTMGQVRLRVFDLRGRLVTTLIDKQAGGPNTVDWDGRNELKELLPLGTYILHLESVQSGNSHTLVKPVVIGTKL